MLVLKRKVDEKILFPNLGIAVQVVGVSGKTVRLGIDAPPEVRIVRDELEFSEQSGPPAMTLALIAENEDARRQLDSANLAIQLANNQLQQGLTDLAEDALGHAARCLQALEQLVDPSNANDFPKKLAVRETSALYRKKSIPSGLVFEGTSHQRDCVMHHFKDLNVELVVPETGMDALRWLLENERPDFALMICEAIQQPSRRSTDFFGRLGGFEIQASQFQIAGQRAVAWATPHFSLDKLLACEALEN